MLAVESTNTTFRLLDGYQPFLTVMNIWPGREPIPQGMLSKIAKITGEVLQTFVRLGKKPGINVTMSNIVKSVGLIISHEFKPDLWRFHIQSGFYPDMSTTWAGCYHGIWFRYGTISFVISISRVGSNGREATPTELSTMRSLLDLHLKQAFHLHKTGALPALNNGKLDIYLTDEMRKKYNCHWWGTSTSDKPVAVYVSHGPVVFIQSETTDNDGDVCRSMVHTNLLPLCTRRG